MTVFSSHAHWNKRSQSDSDFCLRPEVARAICYPVPCCRDSLTHVWQRMASKICELQRVVLSILC